MIVFTPRRFTVIQDRWDKVAYRVRTVEDLKERYYGLVEKLETLHIDAARISKPFVYDADHERRRKQQLEKLYSRTPEQVTPLVYVPVQLGLLLKSANFLVSSSKCR